MPTIAELIRMQDKFQEPRGLNEHNNRYVGFERLTDEYMELDDAIYGGTAEEALGELVDVFILSGAVALALIRELGIDPEQVDQMVESKFQRNTEKYDEAFFKNGYSTEAALKVARWWFEHQPEDWLKEDF